MDWSYMGSWLARLFETCARAKWNEIEAPKGRSFVGGSQTCNRPFTLNLGPAKMRPQQMIEPKP